MLQQKKVEKQINEYLNNVKAHLDRAGIDDSENVLISIREHIEDELVVQSHGRELSDAVVEAVFSELDPPEAYASIDSMELDTSPRITTQFSKRALWGAGFLPFGIISAILFFGVASVSYSSSSAVDSAPGVFQTIALYAVLILGIFSPFVSTVLGMMGVKEVLNSKGKVSGLAIAFGVAMFYPILMMDAVSLVISANVFSASDYWNVVLVITLVVILVFDIWLIRKTWQMITEQKNMLTRFGNKL